MGFMHIKNGWIIIIQQCFWFIFKSVKDGYKEAQSTENQMKWLAIGAVSEPKLSIMDS